MHRPTAMFLAAALAALPAAAAAELLPGGGSATTDCMMVLDVPSANFPAPPRAPKAVDCVDGDLTCDGDGLRNGECLFAVQACANSTMVAGCTPDTASSSVVDHAEDNSQDPRFDVDFQSLQSRINGLGLPQMSTDACAITSSITVRLRGPDSDNVMKKQRKTLRVTTLGDTSAGAAKDVDKVKFTCRPEGTAVYLPTDLYEGTFDRINRQVFAQSCAVATCHDSDASAGGLVLLSGAAYGNIVGVAPSNAAAASDLLDRIAPGDPASSFLYLKISDDLMPNYGDSMPYQRPSLDASLVELVRLWILGDMTTGPAPETGWVVGTDQ